MVDWSVRFGDILVIVSMALAGITYAFRSGRFAQNVATMQGEIKELKEVAKSLAVIITQQAVATVRIDSQEDRLNILDKRIEDLRRGKGLIEKDG